MSCLFIVDAGDSRMLDATEGSEWSTQELVQRTPADNSGYDKNRCWPHNIEDEEILKRILWPDVNPESIDWPRSLWQLTHTCVEVRELSITDPAILSVNLNPTTVTKDPIEKVTQITKDNNKDLQPEKQVQGFNVTNKQYMAIKKHLHEYGVNLNEEKRRNMVTHGLWQINHGCVSVRKLDETHKICSNGTVKLRRQLVEIRPYTEEFVSIRPMKRNKLVPVCKPEEREEIFEMDAVKELYCKRKRIYNCEQCNKGYSRRSSLTYHVKDKHLHYTRFQCRVCDRCFLSKSQFTVHVARHSKKKKFECRKCLQRFFTVSDRNKHMTTCFKQPKFQCKICEKRFQTKESLRCHVVQKMSRRRFKCGMCKAKFLHYTSLYKHLKKCES